jgi:hypothetical protein
LRSSMIWRGKRGSSSGIAAIANHPWLRRKGPPEGGPDRANRPEPVRHAVRE